MPRFGGFPMLSLGTPVCFEPLVDLLVGLYPAVGKLGG